MPYSATVTGPTITVISGRTHYRYSVVEVLASQTTEFVLPQCPETGTMTLYRGVLTAGAGTKINPRLGRTAGFSLTGNDWLGTASDTATVINDATKLYYSGLTGGKIYVRSYPDNAAADHSISTEVEIVAGHVS